MDLTDFSEIIVVLMALISAFVLSWLSIPPVILIARRKNLCSKPNERTAHKHNIPTLGGIAIFAGTLFSYFVFAGGYLDPSLPFIAAGSILIFFVGLKDDIFILDPKKKFITQFIAAILVVLFTDVRITSLYGVFGIGEINYVLSFILSVFVIVAVTNAYNLIDGIDGLAASTGIIASISFGTWFYLAGLTSYAVLCYALAGALIGFIRFNLPNGRKKIFMGDAGSLNTGFILGIAAIVFIQANLDKEIAFHVRSAPAVAIGIMFLPIFDTVRVMFLRIFQRKSPFQADMQHVHHMLLRLGYRHIPATILLSITSIGLVVLSFLLRDIGVLWLLLILVVITSAIYVIPFTLIARRLKKNIKPKVENIIKKKSIIENEIV